MTERHEKETRGAWIIHHARKISLDLSAPAEYSVLDEAGKAGELLIRLGVSNESKLSKEKVYAIARSINMNVRTELPHFLNLLRKKRLIDTSSKEVQVLGVTTRFVLAHTSDIFDEANPTTPEEAAIEIGEMSSDSPILLSDATEYVSDTFKLSTSASMDFIRRATEIGFVDQEGDDAKNILLFNGNLFKRDSVRKSIRVLESLSQTEQSKVTTIKETLEAIGCMGADRCEKMLGSALFEKLKAAGVLDVNTVSNETGEHAFVTLPGAFHKFVSPMIDDSFDMAKALVSALSYGKQLRSRSKGRIKSIEWILGALLNGRTIGPATAIGADYRVLEQNRVVELISSSGDMYYMRLLKHEIGELALSVLKQGDANPESIGAFPSVPMMSYSGPERTRERVRRSQTKPSRQHTHDILSALRGRRRI